MALANFGEQFAAKTLRKFYQTAVTPAITNTNYEGEIQKAGDRVSILSFLSDITLSDYTANTDMNVETIVDDEDQLVVEKRRYYSFPLDRLEDLFTYADDVADTLTENAAKVIERDIDSYVIENAQFSKAGSWVGIDIRVAGSGQTMASIVTTAAGGTLTLNGNSAAAGNLVPVEHGDGTLDHIGFQDPQDLNKGIRLTSGTTHATEWYRITAVTSTQVATIENWDSAIAGSDIPNGDILRGLGGGEEFTSAQNTDGKVTTEAGWGWEFQAGRATALAAGTVYEQVTEVAEDLDRNEIPDTDRHLTVPPAFVKVLKQAAELQPAIAMAYEGVILNGKVGRVGGFDVHQAAGVRVSTRLEKSTATADMVLSDGSRSHQILANHISMITFAYKWAESRVVDAEDQFAKKYQGLHLYGALVPALRRKSGSTLFVTI
ncbi:hypothetical protein CMI37_11715 [Candidatus Pacearchaeota archaeon]|nr:hypothetical protein [Candidatus Pacearchaeota archaeon]|tara:strand:- start:4694 stop:5992 length:1299 start_codon:yes stop_codon:yes gene_type:complete